MDSVPPSTPMTTSIEGLIGGEAWMNVGREMKMSAIAFAFILPRSTLSRERLLRPI